MANVVKRKKGLAAVKVAKSKVTAKPKVAKPKVAKPKVTLKPTKSKVVKLEPMESMAEETPTETLEEREKDLAAMGATVTVNDGLVLTDETTLSAEAQKATAETEKVKEEDATVEPAPDDALPVARRAYRTAKATVVRAAGRLVMAECHREELESRDSDVSDEAIQKANQDIEDMKRELAKAKMAWGVSYHALVEANGGEAPETPSGMSPNRYMGAAEATRWVCRDGKPRNLRDIVEAVAERLELPIEKVRNAVVAHVFSYPPEKRPYWIRTGRAVYQFNEEMYKERAVKR